MKALEIKLLINEYSSIAELKPELAKLCRQALQSAETAYAPYSKFQVGAALLLANGVVVSGNNQENAAYPSGLCAERVAIFYANATYPNEPVEAIAITAIQNGEMVPVPIAPCGSCRQVIAETQFRYGNKIKILLFSSQKIWEIVDSNQLLPCSFSKNDLK